MMLPPSVRIFVCTVPQDMRRSFDTLALVTQEVLGEDPQNGALYVYFGKRANRIKVLWWDRNGYCLLYKRLHRSLFCVPKNAYAFNESRRDDSRRWRYHLAHGKQQPRAMDQACRALA